MEDKVDVIRCRDCKYATAGILEGLLVCSVRNGVGGFTVPEDGYCNLAEKLLSTCGECRHFECYNHMSIIGISFDGICRGFGNFISGANSSDCGNCSAFEPAEIKAPHGN